MKTPLVFHCPECNQNLRFKKVDPGENAACPKCGKGRLQFMYAEAEAPAVAVVTPEQAAIAEPITPEQSVSQYMTEVQAAHLDGFMAGFQNGFSEGYASGFNAAVAPATDFGEGATVNAD